MPNVELVATKDFSYQTRRLKAGDTFTVRENIAKVLIGIKKAELARVVANIPPPPPKVVEAAAKATPQKAKATPRKPRKRAAKKA